MQNCGRPYEADVTAAEWNRELVADLRPNPQGRSPGSAGEPTWPQLIEYQMIFGERVGSRLDADQFR
jgi:hypothetical protein